MRTFLIAIIKCYRYVLSPWLGHHCRFHPSCSCYAEEAVARYGVMRGGWLAVRRLGRCHPFNAGGIDPVPDTRDNDKAGQLSRHG